MKPMGRGQWIFANKWMIMENRQHTSIGQVGVGDNDVVAVIVVDFGILAI